MRENDALTLRNYVFGDATNQEVEEAFLSSLRDPRWMMKWFEKRSNELSPVIEWVRGPGQDFQQAIVDIARQAEELREQFPLFIRETPNFLTEKKNQVRSDVATSLINKLAAAQDLTIPATVDPQSIYKNAPGLTVFISTGVDSMWNSISEKPREPKASDLADIIHSI